MITCFIADSEEENIIHTVQALKKQPYIRQIFLLGGDNYGIRDVNALGFCSWGEEKTYKTIAEVTETPYVLLYMGRDPLSLQSNSVKRLVQIAEATEAGMYYSNYYRKESNDFILHPLNPYQVGSVRDDFDFGSLVLIRTDILKKAASEYSKNWSYAAFYALRLSISVCYKIFHIPEPLYTIQPKTDNENADKQFLYVDPRNREIQLEMEEAFTFYLKKTGAWLAPHQDELDYSSDFPVEASVIIPVKNRERTIKEAIFSVLKQQTSFTFNIIVIDNHSTDHTTRIIDDITKEFPCVIHTIPETRNLGIGGCWNLGLSHNSCGRFAIQLDSDDLYSGTDTLQQIVDTFYREKVAAVVGSYRIVDFHLNDIPPGVIDHKEWSDENGLNNGLRINGFGAPRAYYTPIAREIGFPDTSYGEDYAMMLAITRKYRIARIYTPLYLCRRWEDNSDASLDIVRENANNAYKDWIRTVEIKQRNGWGL